MLLVSCTSIDIVILAPAESSLAMTVKDKVFKHHRGCLEDPFTSIPLLASSYSSIGATAHPLPLWGTKAFWIGKVAFSSSFTKDTREELWKKSWGSTFVLFIFFWNCSTVLSYFFFLLTEVPAPELKNLPWNHPQMCFGGVGNTSGAVEMADRCYWGERANLLMETINDAKHCIADMQKVFGIRVVPEIFFGPL